ncbi:MAG TPA: GYF domain-containing protein [Tepidisphaeraceae bacterium]|jgi:hypothetical protein|nr:GYF domain-containing protein [Tepidisphaeraceae bacterium]
MGNWYYHQNGQQLGPVDFPTLQHMAAAGQLAANDQLWQEGTEAWVDASVVAGLFNSNPASPVTQAAPVRTKAPPPGVSGKQIAVLIIALGVVLFGSVAIILLLIVYHRSQAPVVVNSPTIAQAHRDDSSSDESGSADTGGGTAGMARRIAALGTKSLHGDGVPQDTPKAIQYFHQAAQLGNADAAYALAKVYADGQGIKKDEAQAFHFYTVAAKLGNADAMTALGSAYEHGTGVAADPAAAKDWYAKAKAAKNKP